MLPTPKETIFISEELFSALMKASAINNMIPELLFQIDEIKRFIENSKDVLSVVQVKEQKRRIQELSETIDMLKIEFETTKQTCCGQPSSVN